MNKEGPSNKLENTNKVTSISLQDLVIIKRFLEKGVRCELFLQEELNTVNVIHKKLDTIINELIKKGQQNKK